MEIKEDVVIVGAGIAGIATALALTRVGVRALVLERSHELRAMGAALTLSQNAWVALDALGVANKLTSIYSPFQAYPYRKGYITNIANGYVKEISFTGSEKTVSGPRTVHRSTLLEVLAQELPSNTIRFSSKLCSIETLKHDGSSLGVLTLVDGTVIKAKVVIGCDGVNSVVAQWLGLAKPVKSGRFAARGLAVFPQGHGLKHEIQQFVHGTTRAGIAPINDKELYWFVTYNFKLITDDTETPQSIQKSILERTANFPTVYLDVVRHCDLSTLTCGPLVFRLPWDLLIKNMSKENITVAGDAMHPMTPDLGQGGCSALEDAVILGRHIGNSFIANGNIVSGAIHEYVKERRWRAASLIAASYFSGWIQQERSSWFMKLLKDKVLYKVFFPFVVNVVHYNCGNLPEFPGAVNLMKQD